MTHKSIQITVLLVSASLLAHAQTKEIGNEEITITKDRKVELPKANRIFEKIPPVANEVKEKKMVYSFFDRKPTGIEEIKFTPNIVQPNSKKSKIDELTSYNNYVKLGAGNFGRLFAETYINSNQDQKLVFGVYGLHNSAKRGPVDGENSGSSTNQIKLDGKYHSGNFKLKVDAGYERRAYHFYGYDTTYTSPPAKEDIRQRLNLYNFSVLFENTNPKPKVDYSLKTGIKSLNDRYDAEEIDWGTQFNSHFPIIQDKVTALIAAEAYLTQRSDNYEVNPVRKRNLFRVEPSFGFNFSRFSAKLGFKAVNEFDEIEKINSTKGFPVASLSYKTPGLIYFFAGFDGDIIRNTLHSFYNENPFLIPQINLRNTVKNQEYYIGSRGDLFSGINYNAKFAYGTYQGLYFFNTYDGNPQEYQRRFEVVYDQNQTEFYNVSTELNYQNLENWKTNIKADYFYYQVIDFEKPFHKPNFTARWGNTFVVANKLVASLDFYYIGRTFAKDPFMMEVVKLPGITDLNAEFTYLFSKQFSTFVKLNNIIGKNYQRYYNYPQLGLNFLIGVNVAL
jgi:hypothetical protein